MVTRCQFVPLIVELVPVHMWNKFDAAALYSLPGWAVSVASDQTPRHGLRLAGSALP
jgi:hypothetical protein